MEARKPVEAFSLGGQNALNAASRGTVRKRPIMPQVTNKPILQSVHIALVKHHKGQPRTHSEDDAVSVQHESRRRGRASTLRFRTRERC